jgi:hypothetical protein
VVEGKPLPTDEELEKMRTTREQWEYICGKIKPPKNMHLRDFPIKWDLGIDDVGTMMDRGEKYWLFGIPKTTIVPRPKRVVTLLDGGTVRERVEVMYDSVALGEQFFLEKGFAEKRVVGQTRQGKDVTKIFVLYDKILEGVGTRKTWGDM